MNKNTFRYAIRQKSTGLFSQGKRGVKGAYSGSPIKWVTFPCTWSNKGGVRLHIKNNKSFYRGLQGDFEVVKIEIKSIETIPFEID